MAAQNGAPPVGAHLCRDPGFACGLGDVWLWVWTCSVIQFSKHYGSKVVTYVAIPVLPVVWAMFAKALWSIGTGFEAIGLRRSGSNPPIDQDFMVDWQPRAWPE